MSTETGERIAARCSSCQATFRVPASAAGKRAKCPKCGEIFHVAAAAGARIPSSASGADIAPGERGASSANAHDSSPSDTGRRSDAGAGGQAPPLKFHCAECDGSLKVPARAAGKRVKCPHCSAAVTAPGGAPHEAGAAPAGHGHPRGHGHLDAAGGDGDGDGDGEDSFLDDLGGGESLGASTIPASGKIQPCPHCSAPISAGSSVCLACGKSVKGGGGLAAGAALGGALKGGLGAIASAAKGGNFLMGCIGASIGAIIGGAIWYAIANSTGYEVGWIAWAVGGLTGLGMMFGYKSNSYAAGAVAAGIAVAGIIGGKYAVFYGVVGPLMQIDPFDPSQPPRTQLIEHIASQDPSVPEDEDLDDPKYKAAYGLAEIKARGRVEKMSDEQVTSELDAARADVKARMKGELGKAFWSSMFGGMDIVFFLLAIGTAFKVGAGLTSSGD